VNARRARHALVAALVALAVVAALPAGAALPTPAPAAAAGPGGLELRITDPAGGASGSTALRIVLMLTVIGVAPAILLMMTSFVRFVVALYFLRQALGTPQMPPNQVVVGLALFLTFFVMGPTLEKVRADAWVPYTEGRMDAQQGLDAASGPMREFMLRNTREADLALFVRMAKMPRPETSADVPLRVVVPAFVISELRAGFEIGFLLFLPFLVVDLVVSSVLLSMGMMMLPPSMVSLPFKILLFVLVDGWSLLAGSLVAGVR
jgi:flagellar biosynthetic protein FliP